VNSDTPDGGEGKKVRGKAYLTSFKREKKHLEPESEKAGCGGKELRLKIKWGNVKEKGN